MTNILPKLTSRKFWLAVATVVPLIVNRQWPAATAVAVAYIAAETHLDKHAMIAQVMVHAHQLDELAPAIGFVHQPLLDDEEDDETKDVNRYPMGFAAPAKGTTWGGFK